MNKTNKQNKHMKNNKNLIYSVLLFLLANIMLFLDPFKEMRYMIVFVAVFLFCSVYAGVRFMLKEPSDKKLLKLFPVSLSGLLVVLVILVCLIYLKMIMTGFFTVLL